jgi:hypothetical protein
VLESLTDPAAALNELKGFFQDLAGIWNNGDVATGLRTKGKRAFTTFVKYLPIAGAPGYAAAVAMEVLQIDKIIELLATLVDLITGKVSLVQFFNVMKEFLGNIFNTVKDFVISALPQAGAAISSTANALFGSITGRGSGKRGYEQIEDKEMKGGARGTAMALVESLMDPSGTLEEIKGFFRDLVGIWNNGDVATGLRTKGKKAFLTLVKFLPLAGTAGYAAAVAMEQLQIDKIIDLLADLVDLITGEKSLGEFFNSLKEFVTNIYEKVRDMATSIFPAVQAAITEVANKIRDGAIQVSNQVRDGINQAAAQVQQAAVNTGNQIAQGAQNAANEVSRAANTAVNEVSKAANTAASEVDKGVTIAQAEAKRVAEDAANKGIDLIAQVDPALASTVKTVGEEGLRVLTQNEGLAKEAVKALEVVNPEAAKVVNNAVNEVNKGVTNAANEVSKGVTSAANDVSRAAQDSLRRVSNLNPFRGRGMKGSGLIEHVASHHLKRPRMDYDERFF